MNMPDRFDEEAETQTQTTKTFQHATDEKPIGRAHV